MNILLPKRGLCASVSAFPELIEVVTRCLHNDDASVKEAKLESGQEESNAEKKREILKKNAENVILLPCEYL